jgi:hemerythrin-like domain-containing protein
MEDVLLLLRLEHANQQKLLNVLERQIGLFKNGVTIDYDNIEAIVDYFLDYPNRCHHPKEDALFRKLRARDGAATEAVGNLLGEHEELAELTARLAGAVRPKLPGHDARGERFIVVGERFLNTYRSHMAKEEELFFPAVLHSFTPIDWAEIDYQVFDQKDPLFSEPVEACFTALRNNILRA